MCIVLFLLDCARPNAFILVSYNKCNAFDVVLQVLDYILDVNWSHNGVR